MTRLLKTPLELIKAAAVAVGLRATISDADPTYAKPLTSEDAPTGARLPVVAERRSPTSKRLGKHDALLAELVAQRPGIIVAQAAAQIGVHPTALYPIIRRLETSGQIVKLGRELHPPDTAGAEQLWCEEGHPWTRPTVRGRKPKRCPTHR